MEARDNLQIAILLLPKRNSAISHMTSKRVPRVIHLYTEQHCIQVSSALSCTPYGYPFSHNCRRYGPTSLDAPRPVPSFDGAAYVGEDPRVSWTKVVSQTSSLSAMDVNKTAPLAHGYTHTHTHTHWSYELTSRYSSRKRDVRLWCERRLDVCWVEKQGE